MTKKRLSAERQDDKKRERERETSVKSSFSVRNDRSRRTCKEHVEKV
jgi:hypothetical protein